MKKRTFLLFFSLSLVLAIVSSLLILHFLRVFSETRSIDFQKQMLISAASILEQGPLENAIERYKESRPEGHWRRGKMWVVSSTGRIFSSTHASQLPDPWGQIPKPSEPHEMKLGYRFLGLTPHIAVLRLNTSTPIYLVHLVSRESKTRDKDYLQVGLIAAALLFSTLVSFLMTFFYLRKKSIEARAVLHRLEEGDLKARFVIKRFDEMGSLMIDFNRMASEIERLVGKLQEAEQGRRILFQELSHDLRTPLTSLRTAVDTLDAHWEMMPDIDKKELVSVCKAELSYFALLLESLLFLSQIEEPRYKTHFQKIDLGKLIEDEIRIRKGLLNSTSLKWNYETPTRPLWLQGDEQLLRRLFKNAIENGARYAKTQVGVRAEITDYSVRIFVSDDGAGMSQEDIAQFGVPKRSRAVDFSNLAQVSLGLGSVIMKKIVELHQGEIRISSKNTSPSLSMGTQFEFRFPNRNFSD
jgi:signal transduction histidine kinase